MSQGDEQLGGMPGGWRQTEGRKSVALWSHQRGQALRQTFPGKPEMHLAPESIYQAITGRNAAGCTEMPPGRCGPAAEAAAILAGPEQRTTRFVNPGVPISRRPVEVLDWAAPGHWEGDLIVGQGNQSAIGTLVERATRYVLLLHLPRGRAAEHLRDALVREISALPMHLARSVTWDQGGEMGLHHQFTAATGVPVYFCAPAKPWQRGSNENANGLLRHYFPKGTDLSVHTVADLAAVAAELNRRPRKTLDWASPAERFANLVATTNQPYVATTG